MVSEWNGPSSSLRGGIESLVEIGDSPTGCAIIQVDAEGQNAIVLYPGCNKLMTRAEIDARLSHGAAGDLLLLQNEINEVPYLMAQGRRLGLKVCFNPAPFAAEILVYPLDAVDILMVNETEGAALAGENEPERIIRALAERYANAQTILTLGENGVILRDGADTLRVPARRVKAVDTTAAGDTFIGYYLAGFMQGRTPRACLDTACAAAALCVARPGAMDSIPDKQAVDAYKG